MSGTGKATDAKPPPRHASGLPSDAALARIMGLHPKLIDLSLDRVEALCAALGDPQLKLPPVIHVSGTNGKGSIVAYLKAALQAAGLRAHVYTSPHLVRFHERIWLADPERQADGRATGRPIEDAALVALIEECERVNAGRPITFFEITTAAAFLAFARAPADVVVLETGLGGRLDATNLIPAPAVTAIAAISIDHTQFLGDTLEKIAAEKAGIIKRRCPLVLSPQVPDVEAVVEARALLLGAPMLRAGREWRIMRSDAAPGERGCVYWGPRSGALELPMPALRGRHQLSNAGVALACLDALEAESARRGATLAVPVGARAAMMRDVAWPARMQRLAKGPLVAILPPGWVLWLDGGHNEQGGRVLADLIGELDAEEGQRPTHLVFGMLTTKQPVAYLKSLAPAAASLTAIAIPGEHQTLSAEDAAAAARAAGFKTVTTAADVGGAIAAIAAREKKPARVVVCGSLYLAGTVLAENG
ncbi:MAG: bifunctional folylpolyglutamate synthase/dihydrofolate synthase [Alphaproteobacteria bacterium]|nr:bifunctional folylpolyglutamate synthase/dihydrofolate synthase [Alphaproteobacteria bacterium]